MTTNVYDFKQGIMATESRWSYTIPGYAVIYVDDTEFDKILVTHNLAFMFAGNLERIIEWKHWGLNGSILNMPSPEGIAICIAKKSTKQVIFERVDHILDEARFSGSGYRGALSCWSVNRDVKLAVETAKSKDYLSGGTVKYYDFNSDQHNLLEIEDYNSIVKGIQERSTVMKFQNINKFTKIEDCNDPVILDAVRKLSNGQASLEAPCESAKKSWSDAEIKELRDALSEYFPAK